MTQTCICINQNEISIEVQKDESEIKQVVPRRECFPMFLEKLPGEQSALTVPGHGDDHCNAVLGLDLAVIQGILQKPEIVPWSEPQLF